MNARARPASRKRESTFSLPARAFHGAAGARMTEDHDYENNGAEGFLAFIEEHARIALSPKVEKVVDSREKADIRR